MPGSLLREYQRWFKARVIPRPGRPAGRQGAAADRDWLNPQRGVPGTDRLAVYAEGYRARVEEALAEVYEAVRHVVGHRTFTALSRAYAERGPSREYNLSLIGRHLPAFLTSDPLTQRLPFLPDLATLEWQVSLAFHAVHEPPMDLTAWAAVPLETWAGARLRFQPSVSLIRSAWPILAVWEARREPRDTIDVELQNRPQAVLVARHDLIVRCERVDGSQALLMERLLAGETLGRACGHAAGTSPALLTSWMAGWARAGLIARVDRGG